MHARINNKSMYTIKEHKEDNKNSFIVNFTVVVIILAILVISFVVMRIVFNTPGSMISVEKNGKVIGTYSLEVDNRIPIEDDKGTNLLVIESGKAHMEEASCPDHLCIIQGEISKVGETIVCLPNKVVVTVISGSKSDVDTVVK